MHEVYESMGETGFNSTICGLIAQTLCDVGRYDEADSFAEKSRALAAEDDFASQGLWRMARARVLAASGAFEEALRLADEAVAITEGTDYVVYQGDGFEVRGQVLAAAGRDEDARAAFEEALARYERKGNVPAAARVRAHINGLTSEGAVRPPAQ
jgi:tetratricopeptide (TPR) repeat protein